MKHLFKFHLPVFGRHRQSPTTHRARQLRQLAVVFVALSAGLPHAHARGGVGGGGAPAAPPQTVVNFLPKAGPTLPVFPLNFGPNGFSIVGFIEKATVTGGCTGTAGSTAGGTAVINGTTITVPSDTIVQFPAQTLKWADAVCPSAGVSPIALDGSGGAGGAATLYPSTEVTVQGNIVGAAGAPGGVGAPHVAALIYVSQQSLNSGSGYISFIDYADGSIYVSTTGGETRLVINDPQGRYGRKQTSLDARFAVDDENPTIRSSTGYPMCVPRAAPPTTGGAETDPLCPQKNRPKATATGRCRNFLAAGVILPKIPGGDLPASTSGAFCGAFVMKAIAGMPGSLGLAAGNIAGPTDPDPRQQAPLEVGDFVTWSGTLVRDPNKPTPATARTKPSTNLIWVHSIEANVGIYTQPATLPAYLAVGEFRVGVDPQPAGAVPDGAAIPVETTDRFVFEAFTTDVASLVDVYFTDLNPGTTGPAQSYRWVTVEGVTNTLADQNAAKVPFATSAQPFGGGIQTQFTEAVPGRARVRQNKVPAIDPTLGACPPQAGSQACAVTQSPTRYIRAVLRSLCAPSIKDLGPAGTPTGNPGNLDGGVFFDINGVRAPLPGATGGDGTCLQSARFANGLFTGQYSAPTTDFVFAENVVPGSPITANNFWQMDFLVSGEGGVGGNSKLTQSPRPW